MARGIKADFKAITVIVNSNITDFTNDNVQFWSSFGFTGKQYLDKGSIILKPNMSEWKNNGIALMFRFPKGVFRPVSKGQDTFEEIKQKALEGSGFVEKGEDKTDKILLGILLGIVGVTTVSIAIEKLLIWLRRRRLGEIGWSEKIPYNGDLLTTFKVYNDYSYSLGQQTDNLVSAVVLRLINNGSLKLQASDGNKYELEVLELHPASDKLETMVFNLIKNALGDDLVLQKSEMKKFLNKHNRYGAAIYKRLTRQVEYDKQDKESICDVLALERYLKEFTDIKNKDAEQLSQWKEYMVYAQLFGITDRVKKQLKQVWPDYFEQAAMPYSSYHWSYLVGRNIFHNSSTSASSISGSSGSSSFGGGSGFSGGGVGGGGR